MFETPWFLQTATTEVGRVNKIVEDRLQRCITELEFKQRRSVEKLDRQIDVVKKELKNIHINVDFASDLEIPKNKTKYILQSKDQKRSHSTGKIENKKTKKQRKAKPDKSLSAPVSVLEDDKERDKHFLAKIDKDKGKQSPGKSEPKKSRHPLDRAHTEPNGFLPAICPNSEETAVAYYANRYTITPSHDDDFKLISVIMKANKDKSSPSPKLWRKVKPNTRKHYAFDTIER